MAKKRTRPSRKSYLSQGGPFSEAEGLMEALDRLKAARMTPEEAEKFIEREKQKRQDERKVSKSIKRQESKIEKESERKQKKLRTLREDPNRRSSGGGGGGFGALRGMESNLPGRRKMAKGGEVVAKKSKKKGRRGMGAATRGGGAVA